MSLNEGTSYSLGTTVSYREAVDGVDDKVERFFAKAYVELFKLVGKGACFDVTDVHDDCERLNRQLDYLSKFMTDDQVNAFMKI